MYRVDVLYCTEISNFIFLLSEQNSLHVFSSVVSKVSHAIYLMTPQNHTVQNKLYNNNSNNNQNQSHSFFICIVQTFGADDVVCTRIYVREWEQRRPMEIQSGTCSFRITTMISSLTCTIVCSLILKNFVVCLFVVLMITLQYIIDM